MAGNSIHDNNTFKCHTIKIKSHLEEITQWDQLYFLEKMNDTALLFYVPSKMVPPALWSAPSAQKVGTTAASSRRRYLAIVIFLIDLIYGGSALTHDKDPACLVHIFLFTHAQKTSEIPSSENWPFHAAGSSKMMMKKNLVGFVQKKVKGQEKNVLSVGTGV